MRLSDFKVLSFDCYGTLIDWESGILAALASVRRKRPELSDDEILERFGQYEAAQEHETPGALYPEILARVHARLMTEWNLPVDSEAAETFGASVGDWPAFEDSAAALAYLKRHFRLVVLSNIDRESFKASARRLGVAFDAVHTAQDIGSYKPDLRNFDYLLARVAELGHPATEILHTAQSLFHDHVPANRIGIASAWIDRRRGRAGGGATKLPKLLPHYDFHFASLGEMAEAHRKEIAGR